MSAQSKTDLNFIPDSIVQEKKVQYTKKVGTRGALILMIIIAIISAGFLFYNLTLNRRITSNMQQTEQKRSEIQALKKFGEDGYKLGLRLENAENILDNRGKLSVLASEIQKRLPSGVLLTEWNYNKEQGLSLKGTVAGTYVPIESYSDELLRTPDGEEHNIFKEVKLKNALYDKSEGLVDFELSIIVDEAVLNGSN